MATNYTMGELFGFLETDTKKMLKSFENIMDNIDTRNNKIKRDVEFVYNMLGYWESVSTHVNDRKLLKGCKTSPKKPVRKTIRRA